ncbi:hypothetical protein [Geodermatophilus sp. URMC 64]
MSTTQPQQPGPGRPDDGREEPGRPPAGDHADPPDDPPDAPRDDVPFRTPEPGGS